MWLPSSSHCELQPSPQVFVPAQAGHGALLWSLALPSLNAHTPATENPSGSGLGSHPVGPTSPAPDLLNFNLSVALHLGSVVVKL